MSSHDYTGCQEEACDLCAAHGAGGAKAFFECAIAVGHMSVTPECRCSPCVGLRYAMFTMCEATPGPSAPEPKSGRCWSCDREGQMLVNSVCSRCW